MNEPEKRLTGGLTDLDGLDVSLKLEYRLDSGLRLNAGVSVLPVINQDRPLQYTESKNSNHRTGVRGDRSKKRIKTRQVRGFL